MPSWRLRLLCYAEMAAEIEERIIVVAVAGQALPRSCHALLAVYVCCIAGRRSIRGIMSTAGTIWTRRQDIVHLGSGSSCDWCRFVGLNSSGIDKTTRRFGFGRNGSSCDRRRCHSWERQAFAGLNSTGIDDAA